MSDWDDLDEDVKDILIGHLLEAIEQVRKDVAKVELYAAALNGFSRPVPDHDLGRMIMWLPDEQARSLRSKS
jgi:hypothetical protein